MNEGPLPMGGTPPGTVTRRGLAAANHPSVESDF